MRVLWGRNDRSFEATTSSYGFSVGWVPVGLVVADLEGDGVGDVLTADATGRVLLAQGAFERSAQELASGQTELVDRVGRGTPIDLAVGDLDWDRDLEPASVTPDGVRSSFVLEANKPFLYFKAGLRTDKGFRWAIGDNLLAILTAARAVSAECRRPRRLSSRSSNDWTP